MPPLKVIGPGGEVVGPVAACVGDPADRGVDVHAEQVGEDGGGQVGCEGGECPVAGGPDADSVPVQPGGQGVVGDRLPGDPAGGQAAGSSLGGPATRVP